MTYRFLCTPQSHSHQDHRFTGGGFPQDGMAEANVQTPSTSRRHNHTMGIDITIDDVALPSINADSNTIRGW